MPKPLSDDLRCWILEAYRRREGSQQRLAVRFGVSFEYVRNIRCQWRKSGKMAFLTAASVGVIVPTNGGW